MAWSAASTLGSGTDKVSASSKTITGITASAGVLLIVAGAITSGGGGLTGITVSDSSANTWTTYIKAGSAGLQTFTFISFAIVAVGKTLSSGSVTLTRTGTTNVTSYAAGVLSFTGGPTSSIEDTGVRVTAAGNNGTPSVTSAAASIAGDLFVAVCGDTYISAIPTYTEDASWTNAYNIFTQAASATGTGIASRVNAGTSALAHSPTLTGTTNNNWGEIVLGFFVSGGGASFIPGWAYGATSIIGAAF